LFQNTPALQQWLYGWHVLRYSKYFEGRADAGRLVFVEYREDPDLWIKLVHKMTEKPVRKEMEAQPLTWVETLDVLPLQHIIVFKKNMPGDGVLDIGFPAIRELRGELA
jgi:hypothetical protein